MIYRSNLAAPNLQPYFKHVHCRPMPHSMGHDVLSDFADRPADDPVFGLYKRCGFTTHDEAAIIYNIAEQVGGRWLEIGAHTGWTSAHIANAGCQVHCLEPMYRVPEFRQRTEDNLGDADCYLDFRRSDEFFSGGISKEIYFPHDSTTKIEIEFPKWDGIFIDGDHNRPRPMEDAQNAAAHLKETGVILLHDYYGAPVREAADWLAANGFNCKVYFTPHGLACAWRGNFTPPEHRPDPMIPGWAAQLMQAA